MPLKLIVANKAYSSWSLRAWIVLAHFHIPFEEVVIPLDLPDTRQRILEYSPAAKCPVLIDGPTTVWESLAILEYIAEQYPDKPIWPRAKGARAFARSLAAEMHAGFSALRQHCPCQFIRPVKRIALDAAAAADVARIETAWAGARQKFGKTGPFLFGKFSAADAMYAPVVNRLQTYDIPVSAETRAYCEAVLALPAYRAWVADAAEEPWRIDEYEAI